MISSLLASITLITFNHIKLDSKNSGKRGNKNTCLKERGKKNSRLKYFEIGHVEGNLGTKKVSEDNIKYETQNVCEIFDYPC